ncbi:hypothetical protein BRC69_04990 [Halobacteriales archaeon QH_6_66_25]|nr:MAG: hypothetical protein BRC69_04990 [Halobacteriales archaeon QH_6_66_25]
MGKNASVLPGVIRTASSSTWVTVRKTRQALGRVVRSPDDFGARILLDARYTERAEIEMSEYAVRGAFPPEERAEMIDVDPEKLQFGLLNFYGDLDAYDGTPPTP